MITPTILLVDGAEREPWYASLRSVVRARWLDGATPRRIHAARGHIDLAVVNDERALPHAMDAVRCLAEQGIPTLHVLDGVLEWRNTWENPTYTLGAEPALPFLQPSLCHKVACLGRSQARLLESWGNLGKCEVVGVPRLDHFVTTPAGPKTDSDGATRRILVMTARTPGFTADQTAEVKQSLVDVKEWFAKHPRLGGRPVQPVWRLTQGLAAEIGVENSLRDTFGGELGAVLRNVDAVITTPSTALLEGMLAGRPVALLDYNNRPHYVPAAWSISAERHLGQVISELVVPPAARMLYQDTILHDALECRTPASPRMVRLVEEMVRIGRECRACGRPLRLPRRILPDEQDGHHLPEERFDYHTLYPDHPVFGDMDRAVLRMELGHLRRELSRQGVLEAHPLWGPALRLRRRVRGLLQKIQPRGESGMNTSVAMCTCNGAAFLGEQLESIAAGERLPDEMVVCDDRSTDGTTAILRRFSERAPFPVRLTRNEHRLGSCRNFAKAIGQCRGRLILLADQDDVWAPGKLRRLTETMDEQPGAAVAFSNARMIGQAGEPLGYSLWEAVGFNRAWQRRMRGTPAERRPVAAERRYRRDDGVPRRVSRPRAAHPRRLGPRRVDRSVDLGGCPMRGRRRAVDPLPPAPGPADRRTQTGHLPTVPLREATGPRAVWTGRRQLRVGPIATGDVGRSTDSPRHPCGLGEQDRPFSGESPNASPPFTPLAAGGEGTLPPTLLDLLAGLEVVGPRPVVVTGWMPPAGLSEVGRCRRRLRRRIASYDAFFGDGVASYRSATRLLSPTVDVIKMRSSANPKL